MEKVIIEKREQEKPFAAIADKMEELARLYGREAVLQFIESLRREQSGERGAVKEAAAELDEKETLLEFQNEILGTLRRFGYVHETADGEEVEKAKIFDPKKDEQDNTAWRYVRDLRKKYPQFAPDIISAVANAFEDRPVVDSEDERRVAKPFFYAPKNLGEALDIDWIKKQDFHAGLWDFGGTSFRNIDIENFGQPGSIDGLKYLEATAAVFIYHPKYGDGYRDERGKLMVRDQKNRGYKPFSGAWLHDFPTMKFRNQKGKIPVKDTPREFIVDYLPHLVEAGLLRPEDLSGKSGRENAGMLRTSSKGIVTFESIKYNLGSRFGERDVWLDPISEDSLVVVGLDERTGNKLILGTINRFGKDDRSVRQYRQGNSTVYAVGANETGLEEYGHIAKKRNESADDFASRVKTLEDYERVLALDSDLLDISSEGIFDIDPALGANLRQSPGVWKKHEDLILDSVTAGTSIRDVACVADNGSLLDSFLKIEINNKGLKDGVREAVRELIENRFNLKGLIEEISRRDPIFAKSKSRMLAGINWHTEKALNSVKDLLERKIGFEQFNEQFRFEGETPLGDVHSAISIDLAAQISSIVNAETARNFLNHISKASTFSKYRRNIEELLRVMNPVAPAEAHTDLQDLYRQMKFENYDVNAVMQTKDEKVLGGVIGSKDAVVDLGAGTGRLIGSTLRKCKKLTAVDFTQRHVDFMKSHYPEAEVIKADWTALPFENETQNVIYSLGRSLLHEFTPERQHMVFAEANRVLKTGGRFILDIPNRESGHYQEAVGKYAEVMNKRKLPFREGTIYDSPDGKNFFTRYAYSEDDIRHLAQENGFRVERVERVTLGDADSDDENIYFVLQKVVPRSSSVSSMAS